MNKEAIKEKLQQIQTLLGEIPGVHLAPMMNFAHGNMAVTRKGELKIPLNLPADEMLGKGGLDIYPEFIRAFTQAEKTISIEITKLKPSNHI